MNLLYGFAMGSAIMLTHISFVTSPDMSTPSCLRPPCVGNFNLDRRFWKKNCSTIFFERSMSQVYSQSPNRDSIHKDHLWNWFKKSLHMWDVPRIWVCGMKCSMLWYLEWRWNCNSALRNQHPIISVCVKFFWSSQFRPHVSYKARAFLQTRLTVWNTHTHTCCNVITRVSFIRCDSWDCVSSM